MFSQASHEVICHNVQKLAVRMRVTHLRVESAVGSVILPTALNLLLAFYQTGSIRCVSPSENLQVFLHRIGKPLVLLGANMVFQAHSGK